jgi:hypothetical protein
VSNYLYLDEADKAVAHRQCARNADALKSDEGEFEPPHPATRNDVLIIELRSRSLVLPRLR